MPDMSVPFPEGGCKIRLGVIDNRLPEFDGRVRHQMKNYVGKRVNEFGERVHYNYYDSYDEDRIFIPFWFEDGLRIAFAEGSILATRPCSPWSLTTSLWTSSSRPVTLRISSTLVGRALECVGNRDNFR